MHAVCIFLGSNSGNHPSYMAAAEEMGRELARRGLICVYGGSATGLMKQLADSALSEGGKVVGVTVQSLKDKENFHQGLTELYVLPTMHERKNRMIDLSDGFIALPGGIGTYEEFFEVYTLQQMGFHCKPCGLLNVNNYYTPLTSMLDRTEEEGFLKAPYRESILQAESPALLLDLLTTHFPRQGSTVSLSDQCLPPG